MSWKKLTDITNKQIETVVVDLEGANLLYAHMEGAILMHANLTRVNAYGVHLEEAQLLGASLQSAHLDYSHLEKTILIQAQLEKSSLKGAHLEGANIAQANLAGVVLCNAFFDRATQLDDVVFTNKQCGSVRIVDVRWGDVNLAVIEWSTVKMLGDEQMARQKKDSQGKKKDIMTRVDEYKKAVRANRQLAVMLQGQGLNEEAEPFALSAQLLQRKVFWRQNQYGRWLFSLLLALLSGYGYRLRRILTTYVVVVSLFALVYTAFGIYFTPHLTLLQAFLESITAFHGRVFLEQFNPNSPQIWLTALEAISGLIIEGVFIAMLIQRFFGK